MKLKIGQKAPDFSVPDETGSIRSCADFHGMWTLLYFYPKDDTPGCTKEACGIRDAFPRFKKLKLTIVGVSIDSIASHQKFIKKYKLAFHLLADEEKKMVKAYGVWGKKKFMGREYRGTYRTSFLIDPKGIIVKIYENVKPEFHAEEVLKDLKIFK